MSNKKPTKLTWATAPTIEAAEDSGPPKIKIDAYNPSSALSVAGFPAPVVIDLKTARFEKQTIKINRNHDRKREIGHAQGTISASGIKLEGLLSVPGDDREQIVQASNDGFPWDASIEASFPPAEWVGKSKTVIVNGKQFSGVYVARNAVLTGVAILNHGACRKTKVQIEANEMEAKTREFIEAAGFDPETIDAGQLEFFEKQMSKKEPEQPAPKADPNNWDTMKESIRAEKAAEERHCAEIRRICAEYNYPEITLEDGTALGLAEHSIEAGWDLGRVTTEAKLFREQMKSAGSNGPAIHNAGKQDQNSEIVEAAMLLNSGNVSETDIKNRGWYSDQVLNAAMSSRFRGYRVSRLGFETLRAAGVYHPVGQMDDGYMAALVRANRKLEASAFSSFSLPGIMSNVANKTMLAAYYRGASIVPFVFGRTSATDFKPQMSYQLEGSGMLEQMGPHAQIKHGQLVESEYTKRLETYSKMLSFSRQDFFNDDMNAFSQVSMHLGIMAFKAREYAATNLIATTDIFSAPNGNLLTGNDLGVDGLTASTVAFDGHVDSDGLPISVDGDRILVPSELKVTARQLAHDLEIRNTAADTQYFTSNPHAGTILEMGSAWLSNDLATGGDADRAKTWYRFSDPVVAPCFQVVYLNGQDSPTIQSSETDFNTLGMQFRAVYDFGLGTCDPKYGQKNVGA